MLKHPVRRVLMATINYDHPQKGMINAFRGIFGQDRVRHFDYLELGRQGYSSDYISKTFAQVAVDFKPDWIWMQLQETGIIKADSIAYINSQLPCVLSHWTGDCRDSVTSYLSSICKVTHFTFVSNKGQKKQFLDAGAKRFRYLQIGVDFAEDVLGIPVWNPPFRIPEIVFCGNYYGDTFKTGSSERLEAIRALKRDGFDIGVVGGNWPSDIPVVGRCDVKQQHHVWKRAKIALNINHFNNIKSYYSDRQLIAMASGTPTICKYIPGIEDEFDGGKHCMWYGGIDELLNGVDKLMSDETKRNDIGRSGREEVIKNHTWYSRILSVLPEVERVRQGIVR